MGTDNSIYFGNRTKAGGHASAKTSEYNSWKMMKARCYNPNASGYHRYGGRQITVCQRWRESFLHFLADMGPKPSPAHSIERLDNDAGYSPNNCKWSTRKEQQRNTVNTRLLTYNGESMCLKDWAHKIGIHPRSLAHRLTSGWSVERALSTPPVTPNNRCDTVMLTLDGITLPLQEWARTLDIKPSTIYQRINLLGWTVEKALTTPVRQQRNTP